MTPEQYCQDKAAASGSSFYASFRFLPHKKRLAMTALYAFCREVDDVVDECSDESIARTKLAWWRDEVKRMYHPELGQAAHPVSRALQSPIREFDLPEAHFEAIIDGMQMDLEQARYVDFASLQQYCYRVASVVGLLAAKIFGYQDPRTEQYAHDLGMAFQLTNIIRDVGEDARRGRIYLPVDELQRFNVPASTLLTYQETPEFRELMHFQIERAEEYYQQALAHLPRIDRKAQRTGLIMAAIYRTTLHEIKLEGAEKVLNQRVSLPPIRKLWLAWRTWVFR